MALWDEANVGSIMRRNMVSAHKRRRILERDGHKCVWCARPLSHVPEIDSREYAELRKARKLASRNGKPPPELLTPSDPSAHAYPTIDHIIPLFQGGTDHEVNLVACCRPCNADKGDQDPWVWGQARGLTPEQLARVKAAEEFLIVAGLRPPSSSRQPHTASP